jgi:putative RecB family exonuclease
MMQDPVRQLWDEAWVECKGDTDLTNARVGGRATKINPNKEDVNFWQDTGPTWVQNYINWRNANPNWKIWVTPQGTPAIELALMPVVNGVTIKMIIDRVFEVNGQLVVVDLKTSQQLPNSSLQLGFYKMGLEQTFDIEVNWGNYYMSRDSGTGSMIDLRQYDRDKMEYLVDTFDRARKAQIFLPNTNNCQYRCGLTQFCQFSTKKEDK